VSSFDATNSMSAHVSVLDLPLIKAYLFLSLRMASSRWVSAWGHVNLNQDVLLCSVEDAICEETQIDQAEEEMMRLGRITKAQLVVIGRMMKPASNRSIQPVIHAVSYFLHRPPLLYCSSARSFRFDAYAASCPPVHIPSEPRLLLAFSRSTGHSSAKSPPHHNARLTQASIIDA
jgi:hypothetical protein